MGAPTRLSITAATSRIRSPASVRALTRSPNFTFAAGLARAPLSRTCPPRHASVATVRDLKIRTAQSQRSILVDSTRASLHDEEVEAPREPTRTPVPGPVSTGSRWWLVRLADRGARSAGDPLLATAPDG